MLDLSPLIEQAKAGQVSAASALNYSHRLHTLHWVIFLKWDSKHSMPRYPHGYKNTYREIGLLYKQMIDLLNELFGFYPNLPYNDAASWFAAILREGTIEGRNGQKGKENDIKRLQSENKQLRSLINPFDEATQPHAYLFCEYAIALSEKADRISKERWLPFVTSRAAWIQALRSEEWRPVRSSPDHRVLVDRRGRGRSKMEILPLKFATLENLTP